MNGGRDQLKMEWNWAIRAILTKSQTNDSAMNVNLIPLFHGRAACATKQLRHSFMPQKPTEDMLNYWILISTSFGWIPNNLVTPRTLAPSTALLPAEPHQKRSSMSGVLVRLHAHDFLAKTNHGMMVMVSTPWNIGSVSHWGSSSLDGKDDRKDQFEDHEHAGGPSLLIC